MFHEVAELSVAHPPIRVLVVVHHNLSLQWGQVHHLVTADGQAAQKLQKEENSLLNFKQSASLPKNIPNLFILPLRKAKCRDDKCKLIRENNSALCLVKADFS